MYHPDDANIITTDDISVLRGAVLQERPDGTHVAILQLELLPHKKYTTDNLKLHLTNGVSHRYLMVEAEEEDLAQEEEARAAEASTEAAEEDDAGRHVEAAGGSAPDHGREHATTEEGAEKEPEAAAEVATSPTRVRRKKE
jgi:hypothetical protein